MTLNRVTFQNQKNRKQEHNKCLTNSIEKCLIADVSWGNLSKPLERWGG